MKLVSMNKMHYSIDIVNHNSQTRSNVLLPQDLSMFMICCTVYAYSMLLPIALK